MRPSVGPLNMGACVGSFSVFTCTWLVGFLLVFAGNVMGESCQKKEFVGVETPWDYRFGSDISQSENRGYLLLDQQSRLTCYGHVVGWEFQVSWRTQTKQVHLLIWRPAEGEQTTFTLVGLHSIWYLKGSSRNVAVSLIQDEFILVQPGDIIGWHCPNGDVIDYKTTNQITETFVTGGMTRITVGANYTLNGRAVKGRLYGLKVLLSLGEKREGSPSPGIIPRDVLTGATSTSSCGEMNPGPVKARCLNTTSEPDSVGRLEQVTNHSDINASIEVAMEITNTNKTSPVVDKSGEILTYPVHTPIGSSDADSARHSQTSSQTWDEDSNATRSHDWQLTGRLLPILVSDPSWSPTTSTASFQLVLGNLSSNVTSARPPFRAACLQVDTDAPGANLAVLILSGLTLSLSVVVATMGYFLWRAKTGPRRRQSESGHDAKHEYRFPWIPRTIKDTEGSISSFVEVSL